MLRSKPGLVILLGLVFLANWLETYVLERQDWWLCWTRPLYEKSAKAFTWFEGELNFRGHDVVNMFGVWGYSIAYFFLFPILAAMCAVVLIMRKEIGAFRVLCLATAIDYLISLPFFLFFPVPERWSYPAAAAILQPDRISDELIQAIRPISGLDNCFPSFHTSLTLIIVITAVVLRFRFWRLLASLGSLIVIATFFLGIHWLPDIIAGFCVALISVALAVRTNDRLEREVEGGGC